MQAVEIEPIKSCFQPVALSFVVASQPADEIQHVGIAPHPGRKTFEAFEGVDRFRVIIFAPHKSIHAIGIGPVSFHGYRIEALTLNQTLGDLRALPVELMRSVRGLPQQHKSRVADLIHQRIIVRSRARERMGVLVHRISQIRFHFSHFHPVVSGRSRSTPALWICAI